MDYHKMSEKWSDCYVHQNQNLMGVNFIKKYQNLVISKSENKSEQGELCLSKNFYK